MKRPILLLLVEGCLILAPSMRTPSFQADESYETAVASLVLGSDPQRVRQAVAALEASATKAFPALLAHLHDKAKAAEAFQREEMDVDAQGKAIGLHVPTIGEACLSLIQSQVEGTWPKGYRQYYFLTPENVAGWWHSSKEKSLKQLRIEAARASLRKARKQRGTADYNQGAVRFLENHLRAALAGRNDW